MDSESIEVPSCNICDRTDELVFCEGCEAYYCDACWERLKSHKRQGLGAGGVPHGKSRPEIVHVIKESMAEPKNDGEEVEQHVRDADSIWFGLSQDDGGEPALADYRRYASVILESNPEATGPRYPGLVSFIGPTNSGKSTLIKLLIDPTRHAQGANIAVPVIGRKDCETPTSADVHLYIDPDTTGGNRPILFADCEGFEGGERDPIAQQKINIGDSRPSRHHFESDGGPAQDIFRATQAVTKRVLKWASRNSQHSEQTSKRQYAVSEMYPRIFYAFSDVVVFVLNNPKTIEDVVEKLIKWADANHASSMNMPCKPHAIIAINKSQNSSTGEYWLPEYTTKQFFKSLSNQLTKNSTFRDYVEKWRIQGAPIHDMEELFSRYYWTTTVVRLPEKSRYELMHQQRDALRDVINDCCQRSFHKRKDVSILPDVDEFGMYLSLAFDHFSQTLKEPFDYVKASIQYRPPPDTLEGNLFEFVHLVAESLDCEGDIERIFSTITKIVASYFILDSARKQRMGQPQDWFGARFADLGLSHHVASATKSYATICSAVVEKYFRSHVTCQFEIAYSFNPTNHGFKCELRQVGHNEGCHRMKWRGEHWGEFKHKFNPEKFAWAHRILDKSQPLHGAYMAGGDESHNTLRQKAVQGHGRQLEQFYTKQAMFSNRICLGCLFHAPTLRLRCGHIICYECAIDFGQRSSDTQVLMDYCPLHPGQSGPTDETPDNIQLDPVNAGLRVLVLDGGGVRGIAELCVLKEIQDHLKIPLQCFFDLVVGTSTGGIVSLGFGHELWSVDECMSHFMGLVSSAFTSRSLQKIQGLKYLQQLVKRSKYRTRPFEESLQRVFSDSVLFAPRRQGPRPILDSSDPDSIRPAENMQPLRVAVAAVSEAGRATYMLSNYSVGKHGMSESSSPSKESEYIRARPAKDKSELRVWEAARATSAAPGFFKPFQSKHFEPPLHFMDGAILHNNPIQVAVEEARRLAIERRMNLKPDIVLSIGTGQPQEWQSSEVTEQTGSGALSKEKMMMKHQRKLPFLQMMFTMVSYQVKLNIDCEIRYNHVAREWAKDPMWAGRLHRINPNLGREPPPLDAVHEIDSMVQNVRGWLQHKDEKRRIHAIACKLVASSFYFARRGNAGKGEGSSIQVQGVIKCRLTEQVEVTALGKFLASCIHEPTFVVINYFSPDLEIDLPTQAMLSDGRFDGVEVDITVSGEDASTSIELKLEREGLQDQRLYRLSGFPRKLIKEDFKESRSS